jgi:hypothetical protein
LTQANRRLQVGFVPPGLSLLLAEVRGIFEFNASLMLAPGSRAQAGSARQAAGRLGGR